MEIIHSIATISITYCHHCIIFPTHLLEVETRKKVKELLKWNVFTYPAKWYLCSLSSRTCLLKASLDYSVYDFPIGLLPFAPGTNPVYPGIATFFLSTDD
jgi:hypothetical protein